MYIFKIHSTGDESRRSGILSPAGQKKLFQAKSLLDTLVRIMSDGSVTVKILLLVQKHKATFLELLKTASGVERNDAELSLVQRIEEIEEFNTVRENVGRLIAMCDVVPPGEPRRGILFQSFKSQSCCSNYDLFISRYILNAFPSS